MFTASHGAYIAILQQSSASPGFSVAISFSDDCIQLLVIEKCRRTYISKQILIDVMLSYSTCLGKVDALKREFVQKNLDYGMDSLDLPPEILRLMEEHINGKFLCECPLSSIY